jgi:hypothetical protein
MSEPDAHPIDRAFLARAERLAHGFVAVLRAGAEPQFTVAARETSVSVRVDAESGVVACMIASSRPGERLAALLKAYDRDPRGFVPARETQGSFLFWDPKRRQLLLGRDRTACYHLYTGYKDGALYVATGVEPFLGTVSTRFDPVGRDLFLAFSSPVAPFPIYQGLHPLLPGRYLRLDPAELLSEPDLRASLTFWQIERTEVPGDYDQAVTRYGELFLDNVSDHVEGAAAGVMLSGGSDSACVVGALAELGVPEVHCAHMRIEGASGPGAGAGRGPARQVRLRAGHRPAQRLQGRLARARAGERAVAPARQLRHLSDLPAHGPAPRRAGARWQHGVQRRDVPSGPGVFGRRRRQARLEAVALPRGRAKPRPRAEAGPPRPAKTQSPPGKKRVHARGHRRDRARAFARRGPPPSTGSRA